MWAFTCIIWILVTKKFRHFPAVWPLWKCQVVDRASAKAVRWGDIGESHKTDMIDLLSWHRCSSVIHRRRNESSIHTSYCTYVQICKSSVRGEGRALSWGTNQGLVWKRGLIKAFREWVSHAVDAGWVWHGSLGWVDMTNGRGSHGSFTELSGDISGIIHCVMWHYTAILVWAGSRWH